jgi:hypothetical protein
MLAERLGTDACRLADRWKIDVKLASDLIDLDQWAASQVRVPWARSSMWPGLFIISGQRTTDQNRRARGARDSRHLGCPATAADLRMGSIAGGDPGAFWSVLGNKWKLMGHRWGGDFRWEGSPRPNPKEWNHFDLGHYQAAAPVRPLRAVSRVALAPEYLPVRPKPLERKPIRSTPRRREPLSPVIRPYEEFEDPYEG